MVCFMALGEGAGTRASALSRAGTHPMEVVRILAHSGVTADRDSEALVGGNCAQQLFTRHISVGFMQAADVYNCPRSVDAGVSPNGDSQNKRNLFFPT